jgi:Skp family chaperone for outer membrane proteins
MNWTCPKSRQLRYALCYKCNYIYLDNERIRAAEYREGRLIYSAIINLDGASKKMRKIVVWLAMVGAFSSQAHAQMGNFADSFMKGYRDADAMQRQTQMHDEQMRLLRLQRQELEERQRERERLYEEMAEQRRASEALRRTAAEKEVPRDQQAAEQKAAQQWYQEIANFKKYAKANEGMDYDDPTLHRLWDGEVRRLAALDENNDKDGFWFLSQAHKNVKTLLKR